MRNVDRKIELQCWKSSFTKEKLKIRVDNDFDYILSRFLANERTWKEWECVGKDRRGRKGF